MNNPALDDKFLPFDSWQEGYFDNQESGHKIRYCQSIPENPVAHVVILPGLSEFCEKYIETARFLNENGFGITVIDWAYQGQSTRHKPDPEKRHSDGYNNDLSDLHYLITKIIPTQTPLFMLGHSMGAHIGLRYLAENTHKFKAASFSAPMMNILAAKKLRPLVKQFLKIIHKLDDHYVPGGNGWRDKDRILPIDDIFSSDPVRKKIHNQWSKANDSLRLGSPTFKWLKETFRSISILKGHVNQIQTPVFIAIAGKEALVSNGDTKKAIEKMPNAILTEYPTSKHEILMETDDIRQDFLDKTLAHFKKSTPASHPH